ncbi:DAZ-associated protein 1 isoform X6 [Myxocyprinus asiaticus]|uniref:DAZ-associated protein 1 isoform X6 n=1 Tax=Myxocyprinus asiaticus TaxID=70543 RepID=UPI0022219156|nr:DAZ-associated protein 1 isoform X6 [Myxocyprinus asiaticus]
MRRRPAGDRARGPMSALPSTTLVTEMNSNLAGDEIGKLFVGGLDWSTTQETLRNYFCQYGEVVDCVIMKDKSTNQSRGFGFVKFKDPNCVRTVLDTKPHSLDGRNIDPKPCTPRGMQPEKTRAKDGWKGSKSDSNKSKKIFVGGIPHNCGEAELREYFNRFGVVTEVVMIYDAEKQRPRGFGFITFEAEQSVDQAVNMHFHDIMGKKVEVKKAEPRDSKAPASGQLGANQWGTRAIISAANGWAAQPAPSWQQSYGPQGYSFSTPQGDQFVAQGVPPPPATPGAGPLGFAPATTPSQDLSKATPAQPDFSYSQYGLGNYPQDPSAYGPTRPSHTYVQEEQGYSAGYGQDLSAFGHSFADPSQQTASYAAAPSAPSSAAQPAVGSFGRGQNHNVQGFHPYRR